MNTPLLSTAWNRWLWGLLLAGTAAFGVGIVVDAARAFSGLLAAAYLGVSIAVGAVAFLALHAVANAGWHTAFKRVPEAIGAFLPYGAVMLLLVLAGANTLYGWAGSHGHSLPHDKQTYLSLPLFAGRMVLFLAVWTVFAVVLRKSSVMQDQDLSVRHTHRRVALSAVFLMVLAVTFSIGSMDWLMSIDPHWFSTIHGMYHLGGMLGAATAAITVVTVLLKRAGHLPGVTDAHLHDLGKLLLGFCTLWAYLWLSQYLLIWYANLPEETTFYLARTRGGWGFLFWANLVIGWALPFALLLPRPLKMSQPNLLWVSGFMLAGRWLDIYLAIGPAVSPEHRGVGPLELGPLAALGGAFALVVARAIQGTSLVPKGDPYLFESLHHHG